MNPLIGIAASLFPHILNAIGGSGGSSNKVTETVVSAVKNIVGTDDAVEAQQKIAADPKLAADLRTELARIALEETKLRLDAEQKQRDAALAAEQKQRETALENLKVKLEDEQKTRLADLESTSRARSFHRDLITSKSPMAWVPPLLSIIVTVGFFLILIIFVFFKNRLEMGPQLPEGIDPTNLEQVRIFLGTKSDFVVQIINICVGSLAAAFATVISFWLGSSQSSRAKDDLVAALQTNQADQTKQIMERATTVIERGGPPPPSAPPTEPGRPQGPEPGPAPAPGGVGPAPVEPVKPAPTGLLAEIMPELIKPHRHFEKGVKWALTSRGIAIDGAAPMGTAGEPSTVRNIWKNFGDHCIASATRYGVPVELIVATIATESSGDPKSRRAEPQINDESVGLMQTLVGTAREATGKKTLRGDDLLDPATSIDAGTAYIAKQRSGTHFDPPLVAAAYNAGSIRLADREKNRWKLHCFPPDTGAHIDRFVAWFADSMRVSAADGWAKDKDLPSFAAAFGVAATGDISGPDFPPRPAFRPLLSTEDRQALFGAFSFRHRPIAGNKENIEITDGWDDKNIVTVEIPVKGTSKNSRLLRPVRVSL